MLSLPKTRGRNLPAKVSVSASQRIQGKSAGTFTLGVSPENLAGCVLVMAPLGHNHTPYRGQVDSQRVISLAPLLERVFTSGLSPSVPGEQSIHFYFCSFSCISTSFQSTTFFSLFPFSNSPIIERITCYLETKSFC